METLRLYLDNCSFNRPYDDQSLLRNYLEAEAKVFIQLCILHKKYELAWSYVMDFEISYNPYTDRKNQIMKWKDIAVIDISETDDVLIKANEIRKKGLKPKDSLHLATAIEAQCDFFITTDDKILNKIINKITIIDPITFIKRMEITQ